MCVAASEFVASGGLVGAGDAAVTWARILSVVSADAAARDKALADARGSFRELDKSRAGLGGIAARSFYDTSCATRDLQVRYVTYWGKPELMDADAAKRPN